MIDQAKIDELMRLYKTLEHDAIGEFRPQLEYDGLNYENGEPTGDAVILHDDGDYAAYVMGNLGLGFDCQTMAQYLVAAANLAPELAKENAELRHALEFIAHSADDGLFTTGAHSDCVHRAKLALGETK